MAQGAKTRSSQSPNWGGGERFLVTAVDVPKRRSIACESVEGGAVPGTRTHLILFKGSLGRELDINVDDLIPLYLVSVMALLDLHTDIRHTCLFVTVPIV
jgi:hypothetical protein